MGETEPAASKAYKYRRFDLSLNDEDPVHLIVRTEIDAVQKNAISGEVQFLTVKALNEFDHKAQGSGGALDWRTKLFGQRGAVVATEMKNNSCKLARWTVQSIMAKADVMKLGFVSRANPKTNDKHVILGVVGWKPRYFAQQMNLSLSNGWGIVRTIADIVFSVRRASTFLSRTPTSRSCVCTRSQLVASRMMVRARSSKRSRRLRIRFVLVERVDDDRMEKQILP